MFKSMIDEELKIALIEAADYFKIRSLPGWESEAREAAKKVENNDFSFIEILWIKCAPTCDIDDLLITDYETENEGEVNRLNGQLAEIANKLFALLDRAKSKRA